MTSGEKIKFARTLAGVTQKELSFLSGISEGQIKQYETGNRTPKADKISSIASALGISKNFFITHNIENYEQLMGLFFELQEEYSARIIQLNSQNYAEQYALVFKERPVRNLLAEFYKKQEAFNSGEISKEEFELWKLRYPLSFADECSEKLKNYKKLLAMNTQENTLNTSVLLNLIAEKFSLCKNMDEVAEAVQDIKDMISK